MTQSNSEVEPQVFCNVPISVAIQLLSAVILLLQISSVFYYSVFIVWFTITTCIAMLMVSMVSWAIRRRQPGSLYVYIVYIILYSFYLIGITFGIIFSFLLEKTFPICSTTPAPSSKPAISATTTIGPSSTTPFCLDPDSMPNTNVTLLITSVCFSTIAIILAAIQLRLCLLYCTYLKRLPARDVLGRFMEEQSRTHNLNLPMPPPRYSITQDTTQQVVYNTPERGFGKPPSYSFSVQPLDIDDLESRARTDSVDEPPPYEVPVVVEEVITELN